MKKLVTLLFITGIALIIVSSYKSQSMLKNNTMWSFDSQQAYIYTLDYQSKAKSKVNQVINTKKITDMDSTWQDINTTLKAELILFANEVEHSCYHMSVLWKKMDGASTLEQQNIWKPSVANHSDHFKFTLCQNGTIKDLVFMQNSDPSMRQFARVLLAGLHTEFPSKPTHEWRTSELFHDHKTAAHYLVQSISKSRDLNIIKTINSETEGFETNLRSLITFPQEGGNIKNIKLSGNKKVSLKKSLLTDENFEFHFNFIGQRALDVAEVAIMSKVDKKDPSNITSKTIDTAEEKQRIKNDQLKELIGKETFEQMIGELEKNPDSILALRKLRAFVELHPEFSDRLSSLIINLNHHQSTFHTLASVLSAAGSEQSQQALIGALDTKRAQNDLQSSVYLIAYLGDSRQPNVQSENYLRKIIEHPSEHEIIVKTAELNLAVMARNLSPFSPDRSNKIFDEAKAKLKADAGPDQVNHYLSVLGNIGHEKQTKIVENFIKTEQYKEKALDSLRFVDTDDAKSILINQGLTSKNDKERLISMQALGYTDGNYNTLNAYEKTLKEEKNITIVLAALDNLFRMAQTDNDAKNMLLHFKKTCDHTQLCQHTDQLISNFNQQ